MIAIKWKRPNSIYDGVVQYVSKSLVKSIDSMGNATVLWPRKGREPDTWIGEVQSEGIASQPKGKQNQTIHTCT